MRKFLPFLVSGVLMLLIGLYMIIRPETFLTVVIALFGIYEAIDGLRSFIAIRRVNDVFGSVLRTVSYSKSVISMVVGLIVIIIAILAPNASVNVIRDYEVVEKKVLTIPETICGIVRCINPVCVTNHENIPTKFKTIVKGREIELLCAYCEKITGGRNLF